MNFDNSLSVLLARSRVPLSFLQHTRLLRGESLKFCVAAREKGIRWADARKKIPLPDSSLQVVYSSHVLEHLDALDARRFLLEVLRILQPGGILRLVVPDLERRAEKYILDRNADSFIDSLNMRPPPQQSVAGKIRLRAFGDRYHRWMYDGRSLVRLLSEVGFVGAASLAPGDTTIPDPAPLNLREREHESIYVEARRP